jgi:TonB-linked SusC/RagA family outer membrane protein
MERVRKTDRYRIISNVYGEYSINSNFRLRSSFGVDYLFTDLRQVDPIWFRGVNNNGGPVRISENSNKTFNWIGEQTLNYDQRFGEHSITAVLGFSAQNVRLKTLAAGAFGSQNNRLDQLDNQTSPSGTNGGISEQGLVSQFFRTNYAYKGKYLLTGTVRRDGSSRFGGNNKYGWFPSGSIGWRISEEDFLKNNRSISELKLRASYGSTGSQEIGNFVYAALVNSSNNRTVFGDNYVNASSPTRFENRDIRWERTNALDVGIDLGLFGGRLNFTADYYRKTTDGLLSIAPLSVISGVGNAYQTNIGSIRNTGFEFAVNTRIIDNKDFRLGFDFNISTNKNEVLNIGNLPFINGADVWRTGTFINRTVPGQPIGAFYILRTDGQYLNWADALAAPVYNTIGAQPYFAPGDFKLVDQNKDGKIDNDDREFYGSPFPNYFGGITANIGYKNFTFTAFAPFQHGNYVWNQPFLNASTFEGNVWRSIYDNRYLPSNPGVQTSIPVPRNNNPIGPSDLYLQTDRFCVFVPSH